jgi:hypothetical protein
MDVIASEREERRASFEFVGAGALRAGGRSLGVVGGLALCLAAIPVVLASAVAATGGALGVLMLRAGIATWGRVRMAWGRHVPVHRHAPALKPDAR